MLLNSSGPAEPRWPRTNPRGSADESERSAACWRKAATQCSREAGGRDAEGRSGRSGDAYPPPIPLPGCGWRWCGAGGTLHRPLPKPESPRKRLNHPPPPKMKLETWGRSTLGEPFGLASSSHLSSSVAKLFLEKSLYSSKEPKLGDHFLSAAWRGSIFQVL